MTRKTALAWVASRGAAVGVLGLSACSTPARVAEQPVTGEPVLSLAIYNVNFGIPGDPETVAAIPEADVVLLQETTEAWEMALQSHGTTLWPHRRFRHCCLAGGLGILSRFPVEDGAYIDPPEGGWFPGWVLRVDTPLGRVQLLNVHLRPPRSESGSLLSGFFSTPPVRRAQIEHYWGYLDPALPTIVAGDFNEEPGGVALQFLEGRGFRSAMRHLDDTNHTWRWDTSVGKVTAQIDHVMVDRRFRILRASAVEQGNSDHVPVLVDLQRVRPGSGAASASR